MSLQSAFTSTSLLTSKSRYGPQMARIGPRIHLHMLRSDRSPSSPRDVVSLLTLQLCPILAAAVVL
jgi:hypothetical protein